MKYLAICILTFLIFFAGRRSAQYIYNRQTKKFESAHSYHSRQRNIVFIGDSHVMLGNWVGLLGRCDVANCGYSGAQSVQLVPPVVSALHLRPENALIMCGINNILSGGKPEAFLSDIDSMIGILKGHKITPVLHAILPVTNYYRDPVRINTMVSTWNRRLDSLCAENNVRIIDLRGLLCEGDSLRNIYSKDGVHLNQDGYSIWAEELTKIL